MAGNKKNNNNKNSKKKSNNKQSTSQINQKNQFWAILLFACGILFFLMSLVEGTDGWAVLHDVFRGIFGISSFIVPCVMVFIAILLAQNKSKNEIVRRLCESILGILLISGFFEVFFFPEIKGNTLSATLEYIYNDSMNLRGGGVVGSLIGLSLLTVFGKTGARIIMVLSLIVITMFLTNTSLLGIVDLIKLPFIKLKEAFAELSFNDDVIPEDMGVDDEVDVEEPQKNKSRKKLPTLKEVLDSFDNNNTDDDDESNEYLENDEEDTDTSSKFYALSKLASKTFERVKNKIDSTLFVYDDNDDNNNDDDIDNYDEEDEYQEDYNKSYTNDPELDAVFNTPSYEDNKDDSNIDIDIFEKDTISNDTQLESSIIELTPTEDTQLEIYTTDVESTPKKVTPKKKYKYKYPSTELLEVGVNNNSSKISKQELETTAKKLIETLESFQAKATVIGISRGPAVTRYEVQPQSGIKVSKITNLADDIALNLATSGVRMEAPIPGKSAIGVEVPNKTTDLVSIRELLESDTFKSAKKKSKLSFVVGKDIAGNVIIGDIAKMPHVIIAGATGSGKSVCTNSIIMSILYNANPDEVKFILIDPKIVEFQHYEGIPHLLIPVVTDPKKATGALNWAVQEMLKRYQLFADNKVKDLTGYNQKVIETGEGEKLPQIVIAIDELADLMMVAKGDVEEAICRLAQMARAAGMHLIIATQRPTVDIITGLIKANIPSRIALSVMSAIDSRTIIDINGAEKLLGHGDMLYFPTGMQKPLRVQGCWVSPKDIENTVNFIKQDFETSYSDDIMQEIEKAVPQEKGSKKNTYTSTGDEPIPNSDEELVERAIDLIMENNLASTSMLQRRLKLGYARAGRIMDEVCERGIVGEARGSKPREILITQTQWKEMKLNGKNE